MTGGSSRRAGTNFTNRMITPQDGDIAEDRFVTTTGSYSATASLSGTASWLMQVATFKAAAAGGVDTTAPSVTINQAAGQGDPTSASPINFTVTFNETVTGFAAGDISFAGSTVGGTLTATVTGTGPTYNVAVSGMTGSGSVVVSVPAGAATDAAGNASLASTSTDNSVTFGTVDTTAPTVQSINRVGTTPTNAASVSWTVVFSESVTGVDASDFALATTGAVTGAAITGVSGSGSQYTVTANTGTGSGTLGLNLVDNDSILDASANPLGGTGAGNGNFTGQSYTIDKTQPSVTINQATGQADPTSASPINFTVTFNETVTGFAAGDISFAGSTVGGTLTATVTGTGPTYNVAVSGMTGSGSVVVSVPAGAATDAAGNASLASTSTDNSVTFGTVDTTAPTVQSINRVGTTPTNAASVSWTVVFSESVTGVDASDFALATTGAVTGATITGVSGSGSQYTVTANTGTGSGTLGLNLVDNDSILDASANPLGGTGAGNGNFTGQSYTIDKTQPSVTINQATGQADPTSASPINFTVTFNETVTGFAAGDISFAGSTVGGTLTATVTGTGPTYNVAVSGMTGSGSVVVSVPAGAATDAAGNASLASTSTDNSVAFGTVDTTAPTVQSINRAGTTPTNAASVSWTVVFSESVTGVDASDFALATTGAVTGATITGVSGSGSQYTVTANTGTGSGTLGLNLVDNDSILDASANPLGGTGAGNGNFTGQSYTIDKTQPSVTINQATGQADPTSASPINFTVTFNETVTGFTAGDISFAGSTVGGTLTATVTGTGPTYNVAVSGMTGSGSVVVSVPAGAATDAAGNASLASTSTDNSVASVDTTAPTVQSINRVGTTPTNAASVSWTVLFSESVTGVDASDFALATTGAVTGAAITGVSGSGSQYTVTANTGTGKGTLGLNLVDNDSILDASANPLHGTGSGNGNFTGQSYTMRSHPGVTINQADPTSTSPINFTVTFSETVTNFATGDISFAGSTVGGTLTAVVTGTGPTYNVAVSGMSGTGSVVVSVPAGAATDAAGNASLASTSTDNTVTYNAVAPAPIAFVQVTAATPQTNQSAVTVAYTSAQIAGDTNILAIGWNNATSGNVFEAAGL